MMDIRQIRCFLAVAEELHFGRAAKRLHISQPPVSDQIRRLEEDLGTKLFYRTKRKVELTNAGQILAPEARRILAQLQDAAHLARDASQGKIGRLAVAYAPSCSNVVVTVLREFTKQFANVEISLHSMPPGQQPEALSKGHIDIGFSVFPFSDQGLVTELISRDRLVVAMHAKHPLARRKRIPVTALSGVPYIFYSRQYNPGSYDLIIGLFRRAGISPRIVYEVDNFQMLLELVAGGFGVALVRTFVRDLRRKGLIFRPLKGLVEVEIGVAYRRENRSPVLQLFIDSVKQVKLAVANRLPAVTRSADALEGRR